MVKIRQLPSKIKIMEFEGYSTLWKAVIRPPKYLYKQEDLGPSKFSISGTRIQRTDFNLRSSQGHLLKCSHFEPLQRTRKHKKLPCVVYLHGNCSSRVEGLACVHHLLPANITLLCFDFAGCGMSEGEYISLGYHEKEDLAIIIDHLRKFRNVSTIGLWGRSMGAATALLHGDRDPSIAAMVLDSPFSNLKQLTQELAKVYVRYLPSFLVNQGLKLVKSSVQSRANFDIMELAPIDHVQSCYIPVMFAVANQDDFILPHHSEELFVKYAGDKRFVRFEGDHNSARPGFFYDQATTFLYQCLRVDEMLQLDIEAQKAKPQLVKKQESFKPNQGKLDKAKVGSPKGDHMDSIMEDFDFDLVKHLSQSKVMGEDPIANFEEEIKEAEDHMRQRVMNSQILANKTNFSGGKEKEEEQGVRGLEQMSEEEILKMVMEQSLLSAKLEEQKRKMKAK